MGSLLSGTSGFFTLRGVLLLWSRLFVSSVFSYLEIGFGIASFKKTFNSLEERRITPKINGMIIWKIVRHE